MSDFLEIVAKLGSVKTTAVAGNVRGRENDPGRLDEKIARAIAPGINWRVLLGHNTVVWDAEGGATMKTTALKIN